ncbi:hypothetical protein M569_04400, partial [Genlisea aurea]
FQDIFKKIQLWKLIVSTFGFSSTPELMFGTYLLYYFRVFERQIGSNKYTVFVVFSVLVSLLLEVIVLWQLKDPSMNAITMGPYGLIFSSLVPFYFDIPISTRFRVFSLSFSDKTFIYLAGLQLFLSSWKRSMLPGICGIIAGGLYRLNLLRIRRLKFPAFIASSFVSRLFQPTSGNNGIGAAAPQRRIEVTAPMPEEESIAMLVSMGFDRDAAREALVHARNDVNVATNMLLESQS